MWPNFLWQRSHSSIINIRHHQDLHQSSIYYHAVYLWRIVSCLGLCQRIYLLRSYFFVSLVAWLIDTYKIVIQTFDKWNIFNDQISQPDVSLPIIFPLNMTFPTSNWVRLSNLVSSFIICCEQPLFKYHLFLFKITYKQENSHLFFGVRLGLGAFLLDFDTLSNLRWMFWGFIHSFGHSSLKWPYSSKIEQSGNCLPVDFVKCLA